MNKYILLVLFIFTSISTLAQETNTDNQYSVGLGVGSLYSGLGANFSLISTTDMKYISAGCVEYSSRFGSTCGFGAGWIKTDLFNFDENKHGFGAYITIVGHESYYTNVGEELNVNFVHHEKDVYGAGISYTYFANGIDRSGWTFGLSIHATNADFDGRYGGFYQIGYQF